MLVEAIVAVIFLVRELITGCLCGVSDLWAVLAGGKWRMWVWSICDWSTVSQQKNTGNHSTRTEDDVQPVGEFCLQFMKQFIAFSALTLLVGHQEEHLACKNWVMRCLCRYLSLARCRLFAYGPADAVHPKTPSYLASFKLRLVLPFWYRLLQVFQEKRPLDGCSTGSSSSSSSSSILDDVLMLGHVPF